MARVHRSRNKENGGAVFWCDQPEKVHRCKSVPPFLWKPQRCAASEKAPTGKNVPGASKWAETRDRLVLGAAAELESHQQIQFTPFSVAQVSIQQKL